MTSLFLSLFGGLGTTIFFRSGLVTELCAGPRSLEEAIPFPNVSDVFVINPWQRRNTVPSIGSVLWGIASPPRKYTMTNDANSSAAICRIAEGMVDPCCSMRYHVHHSWPTKSRKQWLKSQNTLIITHHTSSAEDSWLFLVPSFLDKLRDWCYIHKVWNIVPRRAEGALASAWDGNCSQQCLPVSGT